MFVIFICWILCWVRPWFCKHSHMLEAIAVLKLIDFNGPTQVSKVKHILKSLKVCGLDWKHFSAFTAPSFAAVQHLAQWSPWSWLGSKRTELWYHPVPKSWTPEWLWILFWNFYTLLAPRDHHQDQISIGLVAVYTYKRWYPCHKELTWRISVYLCSAKHLLFFFCMQMGYDN